LQNDILTNDALRHFCNINLKVFKKVKVAFENKKFDEKKFLTNLDFNFSRSNGAWYRKSV